MIVWADWSSHRFILGHGFRPGGRKVFQNTSWRVATVNPRAWTADTFRPHTIRS